ncbi:hypothetical protein Y032_0994g3335 [Ancylostoma ceylanicum]|uniref:Uncharacterized protein n=1 Tax=Ancylostoma ceylanicum TaxID=53326 RepID=A0A016W9M6_9BILA|nr:hypothetical protein Y032_0994g3335 [Ancylostoma ceylanicum]
MESGFDLDADVEEIPISEKVPVYDASGNKMSSKGAVRLTLQLEKGVKQRIALFVMAGGDGMLVLGTNALAKLSIELHSIGHTPAMEISDRSDTEIVKESNAAVKSSRRRGKRMQQAVVATVAKRVYMRPGETKMLPIYREGIPKEGIVWSQYTLIPDMIWDKDTCSVKIPVTNSIAGAKLFREGEEVGRFEPADIVEEQPVKYQGNMLERTEERLEDREQRLIKFLK